MKQAYELLKKDTNVSKLKIKCPYFEYQGTPNILNFLFEDNSNYKIQLSCHNHIIPIKEYAKYLNDNTYNLENKNKSTERDKTILFSNYVEEKEIMKAYNILIEQIDLLRIYEEKNKNKLNEEQKLFFDKVKDINLIRKTVFIEFFREVINNNISFNHINNIKYIISTFTKDNNPIKDINENSYNINNVIILKENIKINGTTSHINIDEFFNMEEIDLDILKKSNIQLNYDYIIMKNFSRLLIYSLNNKNKISLNENNIDKVEFHPNYSQIFLTTTSNKIKIWEITNKNKQFKYDLKIEINYNQDNLNAINFIKFIPEKKLHIFIYSSSDGIAKIWNLQHLYYKKTINIGKNIFDFQFSEDGTMFGYISESNNLLKIYFMKDDESISLIGEQIDYFYFTKTNKMFVAYKDKIKFYKDIKSNNFYEKRLTNIYSYSYSYYDKLYDYLYLIGKNFIIIRLEDLSTILNIKIDNCDEIFMKNYNNKDNKKSSIINFLIKQERKLYTCSINSFQLYKRNDNQKKYKIDNKFWEGFFNQLELYDSEFCFERNISNELQIYKKKYFFIDEIEIELNKNFKYSLEEKKKMAEIEINNYHDKDTLSEQYLALVKIMIKDNTNRDVLKKYLLFLKHNYEKLKDIYNNYSEYIESYNDEIKYYQICFTKKELNDIFDYYKELSEKEKFLKLVNYIANFDLENTEIDKVLDKIEINRNNLITFNQPIGFDNEELFYYMNSALISLEIEKFKSLKKIEKIKNVQYSLKKINFAKEIEEDKDKFNELMLIILRAQDNLLTDYNINLLESHKYNQDEIAKKLTEIKPSLIDDLILENEKEINLSSNKFTKNNLYNIDNALLHYKNQRCFKKEELYNMNELYNHYQKQFDFDKFKNFFKKILQSKTIKQAFSILYPEIYKYPFDNEEKAKNFINNYYKFILLKDKTSNGGTNKFTLETKLFLMMKETKNYNFNENAIKVLYPSSIIKTFIHELNHNFYNIYFFHKNGTIPLTAPKKQKIQDEEGDGYIEYLLFNQHLKKINLKQAIYILNEDNYNKSLDDFRKDFISQKKNNMNINGEFSQLNDIITDLLKNNEDLSNLILVNDSSSEFDEIDIDANDSDDVLGFPRE